MIKAKIGHIQKTPKRNVLIIIIATIINLLLTFSSHISFCKIFCLFQNEYGNNCGSVEDLSVTESAEEKQRKEKFMKSCERLGERVEGKYPHTSLLLHEILHKRNNCYS